ncbi:MAG: C-type lectin domain-containing protein, partial [Gammaproteobacteria bacterium]|nr:C-type lectin domain-containing protein [Gammaproteobacteria bacterium]
MHKFLLFVFYFLLHPVSAQSASALKTPYAYPDLVIGTSEYYVVTDAATWEDAKAFAAELGGSLVEIDNVVENSKLYNYLKINEVGAVAPDGGGAKYVWLGGSDAAEEGQWVWPSKKSINFNEDFQTSLWGSGQGHGSLGSEPDNFDNQDCLALGMESWPVFNPGFYGEAGQWNDVDCGNKLPYVVEVDLSEHFTEIKLNSTFDKSSAKRDIQAGIAVKRYSDISYTANSLGTDRLKVLGRFKTKTPKKIDVYFVIKRGNRVYQVIDGVLTAWSGSFSTLTPL